MTKPGWGLDQLKSALPLSQPTVVWWVIRAPGIQPHMSFWLSDLYSQYYCGNSSQGLHGASIFFFFLNSKLSFIFLISPTLYIWKFLLSSSFLVNHMETYTVFQVQSMFLFLLFASLSLTSYQFLLIVPFSYFQDPLFSVSTLKIL